MKSIKPIALKEAKLLSNEEMKLLFGGSATDSGLTVECSPGAACSFSSGEVTYAGTCSATVTDNSVSCVCKYSSGDFSVTGSDSSCCRVSI